MTNFKEYIGLQYKNLGRNKAGIDCYGLPWLIYFEKRGIELPDFTELLYDKDWYKTKNHILENIYDRWEEVCSPYKLYDLFLFYKSSTSEIVNHIGICTGDEKFIHISSRYSSMESQLDDYWKNRLYKVLRYKKDDK